MKIVHYFKNNLDKYSFHAIAWMFWILSLIILFIINIGVPMYLRLYPEDFNGQNLVWYTISFVPSVYFPVIATIEILIFSFLLKKEKINPNFRIKDNIIVSNPIYKTFIVVFNILSWITVLFLWSTTIYLIYCSPSIEYFINYTCPILLILGLIYFIVSKKFLS